jgi:hypothetical protein
MKDDQNELSCAAFQAQLPDLIGTGKKIADHPHVQTCELCRALLADLETIAEAARQLFPVVEPPDELWAQIESKIKKESAGGADHSVPGPGSSADSDHGPGSGPAPVRKPN